MTSVDLSTSYLGLKLANPFMTGASPFGDHLDTVRHLKDAGSRADMSDEPVLHQKLAEHLRSRRYGDSGLP